MAEYVNFYTVYQYPTIDVDKLANFTYNNYIVSGVVDFSKPFELNIDVKGGITTGNTHLMRGTNLTTFDRLNTLDIYIPAALQSVIFAIGDGSSFRDLEVPCDYTKDSTFTLKWDGEKYIGQIKYSDGTSSPAIEQENNVQIPTSRLTLGFSTVFTSDLNKFLFRHIDGDYRVKLVHKLNDVTNPGTIEAKLQYLKDTSLLFEEIMSSKGIEPASGEHLRDFVRYLKDVNFTKVQKWEITDNGNGIRALIFPLFLKDSADSTRNLTVNNRFEFSNVNMDTPSSSLALNIDGSNWTGVSTTKYRNSIFSVNRWYAQGSTRFYLSWGDLAPLLDRHSESIGYFVTGDNGEIIKQIDNFDTRYLYKPDQYPANFLSYVPSDMSLILKAGTYESDNTKPKGTSVITVDGDQTLLFDDRMVADGYLTWRDADYNYSLQISRPSTPISISTYNNSLPNIPDYIRSRKMKTTSSNTSYITLYNTTNSTYQRFTNDFVDINPDVQNSQSLYFRYNSSSNFAFFNIGDQYIIRTEVGDGFRNYPSNDFTYKGYYLSTSTSLTHTRQLTMLDGSTRLIDDGENKDITLEELRNIDYIDDIYTVNSTDRYSYNRPMSITHLVTGTYLGSYSYGINFSTDYDRLSLRATTAKSPVEIYANVKAGNIMEGFSNTPKYPIISY